MEFRFNCHPLFRQRIVRINNSLLPTGFSAPCRRSALDATAQISEIINSVGQMSAQAQGLSNPVTTSQKLRSSDHHIYLMFEPNEKNGLVVGILKVGRKSLYVFDQNGETVHVTAPCVLDFYVHESRQRGGLGRELYDHMLNEERITPSEMAIDRPSEKLLGFLQKHYGLNKKIPQMNNFVVYEGFFAGSQNASDIDGRRMHITASPNTNLFGPTFTTVGDKRRSGSQTHQSAVSPAMVQQPPVGRYAAKRPSCSMAQIIHNSPTAVSTEPNSTSPSSTNNHHAPPSAPTTNNSEFENDHQHHHHHHDHEPEEVSGNGHRQEDQSAPAHRNNDDDDAVVVADDVLSDNLQNLNMSEPSDYVDYHHHHHQHHHQHKSDQEVKFADDYADIPDAAADPDPYSFHPHHLELTQHQEQHPQHQQQQMTMINRENSASPQSISQQQTPEHPALKKPIRFTKQHTGLKNMSFGVGAAVTPTGKMEFDQEENEGFGSVKINRPIGKSSTRNSLNSGDNDNESVHSKGSDSSHLTEHGHFDLKFYHNKLW
ncbi:alpha-tubulin N-acetyltransferase [Toxorhynchites rutilus septentrionalis]|uniref:alpha-tubulin N-acetyltransferase n=1 Tax=Toxorhynchites rutilus septentrionalis TaxID=329112 RepID=UPI00247B170C|nr:alpha-tubulin N-acetyltransferase [Toxorhynchites rutilus septentrionalis]XP_055628299.1 alpha-tubulin N-acetyltransferase [Toxorhynchites rutilus septentrionalis]XP_055628300.1 alpha-tubulin N-acetyltransferase [Toxorhynchites rutilus septentrionalis]XP_055628302.1 alpha-tubulin N-acetyltransferase [Toxorhynchites rutilus septentrionalis]XP_055628303.1 alpha-tubulin N-acetyltransferase [Toxorhynchites rutilus septentrionalis]